MLKKSIKMILVLAILLMVSLLMAQKVLAANPWDAAGGTNITSTSTNLANNVGTVMGKALYIIQVVGMGVAVIMLVVLAIKYIAAAPSDKAEIKKHAVVYVVGAVILFGASGIVSLIRKFAVDNVK